jgi:hypothetical protein
MKLFILLSSFLISVVFASPLDLEMKELAMSLKLSLKSNLMEQLEKKGPVEAITFCKTNIKDIGKKAAGPKMKKFLFGRTSHKLRNIENKPKEWMTSYLSMFEGKTKDSAPKSSVIYYNDDGKGNYLEPLYVEAQCLLCHGENISSEVQNKIKALYPKDQAVGFKEGEFRGFVWISEK